MIRTFTLRDFKGHRDTQLELGRFTMLVGDNASGKTSVLEALALQANLGTRLKDVYSAGDRCMDLVRRGSGGCSRSRRGVNTKTTARTGRRPWNLPAVSAGLS